MNTIYTLLAVAALAFPAIVPATAGQSTRNWEFDDIRRIELDGVSGDLTVRGGAGVTLELEHEVSPPDAFRAEVDASGGTLRIREDWSRGRSRGSVDWNLTVPADADLVIAIDTASGGLDASGVSARFSFDTASGDIRLSDMTVADGSTFDTASGNLVLTDVVVGDDVVLDTASGNVELTDVVVGTGVEIDTASGNVEFVRVRATDGFTAGSASGDVVIEDSEGVLSGRSASGDVRVSSSRLGGPAEFTSASGTVTLRLDGALEHDLDARSASGDVRLDAALPASFTLVMTRRRDRGSIDSPFEPTSEEEFRRNGRTYVRETVVRGSGGPEIRLSTASGSIRVQDR